MYEYETINGPKGPNERHIAHKSDRSNHRSKWLLAAFLLMGSCSYMGWQFLWRSPTEQILEPAPNRPYDRNAGTAVLAETGETDSGSLTQAFTAEAQTPVAPLPPPTAPESKPAIAKRQTQDKSKPPLDKMAAETGLLYDPNPGRADETDEFAHAQADNVGGLGDNSGDGVGVGVEYADPPQITDVTDPPIAVAAQGKVIEEKALETAESAPVEILQVPAEPLPPERVPVPQLSAEITYAEVQESPQTPIIYDPVIVPAPVPPPSPAPLPEINVILEKRTIPAPQAPAGPIVIGDAPVAYYPP